MSDKVSPDQWLRDNALNVLDAVVDAIIAMDQHGTIHYANEAAYRMFGFDAGEFVGKDVETLMPQPHRGRHKSYVGDYLNSGKAKIIGIGRELVAQAADGRQIPIYLAVSEIRTPQGIFFAGILRDLSAEKEAQAALLEHQDRLARVGRLSTMGEMTASIAHEINQPLTAISMYAQASVKMLESGAHDPAKVATALEKLSAQSLRAGAIIERIQRFVRNEHSQRELCRIDVLIGDIAQFVQGDARLHDIDLVFDLAKDLPQVYCDPIQIQQVALNLIRNAIDAMEPIQRQYGNRVTVQVQMVNDWIEVSVEDLGTGVAPAEEKLVFSAFHSSKKDGMGMGLSICRSIIDQHGGQIGFANNPEHGATFYFRLPVGGSDEQ